MALKCVGEGKCIMEMACKSQEISLFFRVHGIYNHLFAAIFILFERDDPHYSEVSYIWSLLLLLMLG